MKRFVIDAEPAEGQTVGHATGELGEVGPISPQSGEPDQFASTAQHAAMRGGKAATVRGGLQIVAVYRPVWSRCAAVRASCSLSAIATKRSVAARRAM
ncbi:MAG: hypothetical protein WB822_05135 [Rhodoplanes sp.]